MFGFGDDGRVDHKYFIYESGGNFIRCAYMKEQNGKAVFYNRRDEIILMTSLDVQLVKSFHIMDYPGNDKTIITVSVDAAYNVHEHSFGEETRIMPK